MSEKPSRKKHLREIPERTAPASSPDETLSHGAIPMTPGSYTGAGHAKQLPARTKKRSNVISNILLGLGIVLLVVAAGIFINSQLQYHAQDAINEKLATYATVDNDASSSTPSAPQVNWAALKQINPDVVGWIQIPGTVVNYPVYQGKTNEQYLHTSATGEYSIGGQIFLDYENKAPGLVDQQTVIYGHHLLNKSMFTPVDAMSNQDEFNKVKTVWYVTEQASYELQPLFFYRTPATNGEARHLTFASDTEFHAYLSNLLSQSSSQTALAPTAVPSVSKVVTLGTCDYDNNFGQGNGRGLLVCALKSEISTPAGAKGFS